MEHVWLVEDQPLNWNAINALCDLYIRAGAVDSNQDVHGRIKLLTQTQTGRGSE